MGLKGHQVLSEGRCWSRQSPTSPVYLLPKGFLQEEKYQYRIVGEPGWNSTLSFRGLSPLLLSPLSQCWSHLGGEVGSSHLLGFSPPRDLSSALQEPELC